MKRIIFDIETASEDFDALDKTTQEVLTKWIKKESASDEEYQTALQELKDGLGFSPFTGEIIVIGLLDSDENRGAVYFQAPGEKIEPFEKDNFQFRAMSEPEMLQNFWRVAAECQEFVSFNGRGFDVPFLMIRSAIHKIKPTKDLMSNRYLGSQKWGALHIDLQDQLSFYGAVRRKGNLHLWTRAFGIQSPKAGGVSGEDVGRLFRQRQFLEIAQYNAGDLLATKALFEYWNDYIRV